MNVEYEDPYLDNHYYPENLLQDEYEDECRRDEEETLREIVNAPATPEQAVSKKVTSKQKQKGSPATPATLASIEESPAECELSLVSSKDASPAGTPPRKKLENAFDDSLLDKREEQEEKGEEQGKDKSPLINGTAA